MPRNGHTPITFDAEKGVLLYASLKSPRRAVVGVPYKSHARADNHVTECVLLGIVDSPDDVKHVRVRTLIPSKRASDRIIGARGFFSNYITEPVAPLPRPAKEKPPQVPVTVDAIAMLDLNDTLTKCLAEQEKTNALLAQLVEKWQ